MVPVGNCYIKLVARIPLVKAAAANDTAVDLKLFTPSDPSQTVGHTIESIVVSSVLTSFANTAVVAHRACRCRHPKWVRNQERGVQEIPLPRRPQYIHEGSTLYLVHRACWRIFHVRVTSFHLRTEFHLH